MPKSQKGHKFILCIIDEMTNYLITVPIHHARSEEVGEALIGHIISKFCAPNCIIMDQDSAFMSTLMNYSFRKLNIKIMTVALYNHQSLQAEHGINSLSRILTKHLSGKGQIWHKYLPLATFTHNTFHSPNLANHSPYKLVFGRKPKLLLDLEIPKVPFACIAIDTIGKLPTTSSGNRYALTFIDLLTSYVIAVPIPNKAVELLVEAYLSGILSRTGVSLVCLSDNRSELKKKSDEHCFTTNSY